MAADGALSQTGAVAALEDWLDSSGEMDDLLSEEGTQQTDQTEDNSPEDNEEDDSSDPANDADGTDPNEDEDEDEEPLAADAEDGEEGDEDGDDLGALDTLAEYFELEPDEVLESLEVPLSNGETLPVAQIIARYEESEASFDSKVIELQDQFRGERDRLEEVSTESARKLGAITMGLLKRANAQYSEERMRELRETDSEAYIQAIEAKAELDKELNQAIEAVGEVANRQGAQGSQDVEVLIKREHASLLKAMPSYRDPKVYSKAMQQGIKYLKVRGFTDEDINGIVDHRMLLVVADAVSGATVSRETSAKKVEKLRKKGLKKPSPGMKRLSRRDAEHPRTKAKAAARAKLRKTGDARDAAMLLEDFID